VSQPSGERLVPGCLRQLVRAGSLCSGAPNVVREVAMAVEGDSQFDERSEHFRVVRSANGALELNAGHHARAR
jgi:hypothetical protein